MFTDSYTYDDDFGAVYVRKPDYYSSSSSRSSSNMNAILQTFPPLGQATAVESGHVDIQLVLQEAPDQEIDKWEIYLWHSVDGSDWLETKFLSLDESRKPLNAQDSAVLSKLHLYATSVDFQSSVKFTLKFRENSHSPWTWVRDHHGLDDGIILRRSTQPVSDDIVDLIKDLDGEWKVSKHVSESPDTQIWSLKAGVPPSKDDRSGRKDIRLGNPWGSITRWFALVRERTPWLAPRHGKGSISLQEDAILCGFLGPQGRHLVFLAVSGVNDVTCVFKEAEDGGLSVHARSDQKSQTSLSECIILVAEGASVDNAVAAVMYQARNLVSQPFPAAEKSKSDLPSSDPSALQDVKPTWQQSWNDGLGYCTWNSLGQDLTEERILHALDDLEQNGINVSTLIIDDNWQAIDSEGDNNFQRCLRDFEANPACFPNGLKSTVSELRKRHPKVRYIAVWHALLGYWGGLTPDGKLAKSYKTIEVDCDASGRVDLPLKSKITVVAKEDVARFYQDFYAFLEDAGISAVKTDAQFMVDNFLSSSARRELTNEYFDAWTIASLLHFSMDVVSCMSMFPQAVFYSQMKKTRPSFRVRSSTDFYPHIPDSHAWHVWANAQNGIMMQYLNVIPDWDMFQTVGEYAGFHAAARCISGGPIYITDVPGKHDLELLKQITGPNPLGQSTTFRPNVIGKSVLPYSSYDDGVFLQIGSYHGASGVGASILGVFNVSNRPLVELIPLSHFRGIFEGTSYVIRAHSSGRVTKPATKDSAQSFLACSLDVRGYDIFSAVPLEIIPSKKHGTISIANFGLLGKMSGSAALVTNVISHRDNDRVEIDTSVKAFGNLGIYISALPNIPIDDLMITIQHQPIPVHTVSVSAPSEFILEIDVGKAFNEMGLDAQWQNEVQVQIFFGT